MKYAKNAQIFFSWIFGKFHLAILVKWKHLKMAAISLRISFFFNNLQSFT